MNKKLSLILTAAALILLILGASFLYNRLGSQVESPQLATPGTTPPTTQHTPTNTAAPTETVTPTETTKPKTEPLPDFTVYDLEGNPVKLSDFRGKPVVLNFWSSRCGPCKREMPDFETAYAQYGENIHFVMLNVTDGSWDTVESASQFILDNGYTFPVYYDTDNVAAYLFGVSALPTTFFIDAEGQGVAYAPGALDMQTLLRGIGMIYSEQ